MSDMIERVARAICNRADDEFLPNRDFWLPYARAAIEAMRDPTNDMTVVGWKEAEKRDAVLGNGEIAIIFNAMIDAALSKANPHSSKLSSSQALADMPGEVVPQPASPGANSSEAT